VLRAHIVDRGTVAQHCSPSAISWRLILDNKESTARYLPAQINGTTEPVCFRHLVRFPLESSIVTTGLSLPGHSRVCRVGFGRATAFGQNMAKSVESRPVGGTIRPINQISRRWVTRCLASHRRSFLVTNLSPRAITVIDQPRTISFLCSNTSPSSHLPMCQNKRLFLEKCNRWVCRSSSW